MSFLHYLLWGYLILFGIVAFLVYAACVMAGRADRSEHERRQRNTAILTRFLPPRLPLTPKPPPPESAPLPVNSTEKERTYT